VARHNILSRGIAIAGRVAATLGAVAAIGVVYLIFAAGSEGYNECARLADQSTWEYAVTGRPIPPEVAACEHKRAKRQSEFTFAAKVAGALLAAAAAASPASKLVRRAEDAAVATSRQRKVSALRRGADVRVIGPASRHRGQTGRVIDTLPSTDEFDLIVTFDETNAGIYAFKYQELKPLKATALSRSREATKSPAPDQLVLI
jgi:hypothetical protein